jgi:hypothetical protein
VQALPAEAPLIASEQIGQIDPASVPRLASAAPAPAPQSPVKRIYAFVDPQGQPHTGIDNLAAFCRQMGGLSTNLMSEVARGKKAEYKGWKALAAPTPISQTQQAAQVNQQAGIS